MNLEKTLKRFLELSESHGMWVGVASGMIKSMIIHTALRDIPTTYNRIDSLAKLWQRAKEETE